MSFIDEYFSDIEQHHLSNANQGITTGGLLGPAGMLIGGISGYLYGDEIKSTYTQYENQILGGLQVAGGILTLAATGAIESGSLGTGTAVAVALGFVGSDAIAAGISRMFTDKEVTTLGEDVIAWSGLVPKGYEGITYGLVDLALGSKAMFLSKLPLATRNIVSIKYLTPAGQKPSLMRDIKIYIDKISKNTQKQRHVIKLKNADDFANTSKELLQTKPLYSPAPAKWIEKGGEIEILDDGTWLYRDWNTNVIKYTDGFPDFKNGGFVRQEVNIGQFTTRYEDFKKADQISIKAADGTWHHYQDGKTLQEVESRIHSRFTHRGGFSIKKE